MVNSESMKIEDLKTKIADAINNSDLSPSVIKLVIDGVAKEVTALASQELVADIKKWRAEQEEEKNEKVIEGIRKMKADQEMAKNIQPQAKTKAKTIPVYDDADLQDSTVPVDNKIDLQDT